jgi:hypothetical protein
LPWYWFWLIALWKAPWNLAEPVLQDVGEANQDRHREAAQLQAIDEPLQIDAAQRILGGDGPGRWPCSLTEK